MMMKTKTLVVGLTGLSLFTSGCGIFKNLDEMHDATIEMNNTTKDMNNTTKDLHDKTVGMSQDVSDTKNKSKDLLDRMETTLYGGTSSFTATNRSDALKELGNTDTPIDHKLVQAATLIEALEYQHWDPKMNTPAIREELMAQDMELLIHEIVQFVKKRRQLSPFKTGSRYEALYTLASTLEKVHIQQKILLEGTEFPVLSPLDIMTSALQKLSLVKTGRMSENEMSAGEKIVIANMPDVIYILRMRYNFLLAYTVALASRDPKYGDLPTTWDKIITFLGTKFKKNYKFTPTFDSQEFEQINEVTKYTRYAFEVKTLLDSVKIDAMTNPTIKEIIDGMDLSSFDLNKITQSGYTAKANAIGQLSALRSQLRK